MHFVCYRFASIAAAASHQFPQHRVHGIARLERRDPNRIVHAPMQLHHPVNQAMQVLRLPEHDRAHPFNLLGAEATGVHTSKVGGVAMADNARLPRLDHRSTNT